INHGCCILLHTMTFFHMYITIKAEENTSTTNNPTAASTVQPTVDIPANPPADPIVQPTVDIRANPPAHPTADILVHSSVDICADPPIEFSVFRISK
ncbi:unnamed protein product, partial [Rotaria sp. Silwood1]